MSKVLVTQSKLDTLAGIIGGKSSTEVPLTLDEMITAADSITSGGSAPTLQTKSETYTPSTSQQTDTITPDAGYDGLDEVDITVNAVPTASFYTGADAGFFTQNGVLKWRYRGYTELDVGEGDTEGWISAGNYYGDYITRNAVPSGTTITPTTSSQTIGGANYMMEGAVTVSAMPTGTAGTPTATKGAVSSHSISVTPSVTNTTGYITGSTKTGTAVSVSASELVSGTLSVSTNGQQDVTNYKYVDVNVSGGGGSSVDTKTVTASNRPSSLSFTSMKGEPIAWFLKATFTMTSSSSTYYYVDSMRYNGSDVTGRLFRMGSTRQTENVTTGYSYTYSGTTLTVTSSGNRTTSPGCFYNGSYELVYVY